MLKKKSFYVVTLILGTVLIGLSLFFRGQDLKSLSGVFIGIGAGLFGMSIANLLMKSIEEKNPKTMKKNEIEFKDERNTLIRYRSKAKAGDIIQWFIMGIAYLTILINGPLWLTLVIVLVFSLYNILGVYLMAKYQKEM